MCSGLSQTLQLTSVLLVSCAAPVAKLYTASLHSLHNLTHPQSLASKPFAAASTPGNTSASKNIFKSQVLPALPALPKESSPPSLTIDLASKALPRSPAHPPGAASMGNSAQAAKTGPGKRSASASIHTGQ